VLSRRNFLALAGGAAGALVLAACGGGNDSSSSGNTLPSGQSTAGDDTQFTQLSPIVLSSDLYQSPRPQRFAFALTAKEGFASQGALTVAVAPDRGEPTKFVPTTLHQAGLPQNRGVYVADITFDKEGVWRAVADRDGEKLPFAVQVKPKADAPTAGSKAPTAASPTPAKPLGMNPICTRSPMCPLHTQSLDTIIGKGKPVAVLFATPARCQSQYCGPVLDTLLPLVDSYKDRIDFVHCDIYMNLQSEETSPTVTAWGIPSEPWLFGVDPSGAITARLDGAFGQDEMKTLLDHLATT
jgi:hypothetical protein